MAGQTPETRSAREAGTLTFEGIVLDPSCPDEQPAVIGSRATATWGDLRRLGEALGRQHATLAGRRVGVLFRASPIMLATLAQLDRLGCDVFMMDESLSFELAGQLGAELRLAAVLGEADTPKGRVVQPVLLPGESPGSGQSSVTILTSGTTGKPKAARHNWESLTRPVRIAPRDAIPRWLLTFRAHLYAGLQVILQCLANRGTLVVPDTGASAPAIAELMTAAGVEYASATPSYWRRLLLFGEYAVLRTVRLVQITLGGEVVDQHILDALHHVFPSARIVHIYATTELGRCFSVTDGLAGFPARYLAEPTTDGVELRVEDGELIVRSANAMQGYDRAGAPADEPARDYRTGDLVEISGDRVYFVGRLTDMINVGGNKVHPVEVERVLRGVPGVADARVFGKRSSIAGELVACHVVAAEGIDPEQLREKLVTICLARLTPFQRPRAIEFVSEIALESTGKMNRRAQP